VEADHRPATFKQPGLTATCLLKRVSHQPVEDTARALAFRSGPDAPTYQLRDLRDSRVQRRSRKPRNVQVASDSTVPRMRLADGAIVVTMEVLRFPLSSVERIDGLVPQVQSELVNGFRRQPAAEDGEKHEPGQRRGGAADRSADGDEHDLPSTEDEAEEAP
jgi:hypothetical protein